MEYEWFFGYDYKVDSGFKKYTISDLFEEISDNEDIVMLGIR